MCERAVVSAEGIARPETIGCYQTTWCPCLSQRVCAHARVYIYIIPKTGVCLQQRAR